MQPGISVLNLTANTSTAHMNKCEPVHLHNAQLFLLARFASTMYGLQLTAGIACHVLFS